LINFIPLYRLIYIIYKKKIYDFGISSSLPSILLKQFSYKNTILLVSFKNIEIYIIFVILLVSLN